MEGGMEGGATVPYMYKRGCSHFKVYGKSDVVE